MLLNNIFHRFLWFHSEFKKVKHPHVGKMIEPTYLPNYITLPVDDFREIKREILRYGAQGEVVLPVQLRNEI